MRHKYLDLTNGYVDFDMVHSFSITVDFEYNGIGCRMVSV